MQTIMRIFAALCLCLVITASPAGAARTELDTPSQVIAALRPLLNYYWGAQFRAANLRYRAPKVAVFGTAPVKVHLNCDNRDGRRDGLLRAYAATYTKRTWFRGGAWYCRFNETVYLDRGFLAFLISAVDDFAAGITVAHEWSHHVQTLLGWPAQLRNQGFFAQFELHADCYAGVFSRYAAARGVVEGDDSDAAYLFLSLIGSDKTPWWDSGAHGSGAERSEWFALGFESGDPAQCDSVYG